MKYCLGNGAQKTEKKLTNVSLVCMYVGRKSEMSGFFCFFFPTEVIYGLFQWSLRKKNVSFYGVCMHVRPKLTFVSFFLVFFVHLSLMGAVKRKNRECPQRGGGCPPNLQTFSTRKKFCKHFWGHRTVTLSKM